MRVFVAVGSVDQSILGSVHRQTLFPHVASLLLKEKMWSIIALASYTSHMSFHFFYPYTLAEAVVIMTVLGKL